MPIPVGGWGFRECEKCKALFEKKAPVQRFCVNCGKWRDKARKIAWQREQDRLFGGSAHRRETEGLATSRRVKRKERGEAIGLKNVKAFSSLPVRSDAKKVIRFEFPNDGYLSKNSLVNMGMVSGKPFTFVRKDIKKRKEAIGLLVMAQLGSYVWPRSKTFIDIMVQKHMVGSDAINVVDTVCDAIKKGLDVDDEWFCIGTLDWEVVKRDPKIYVQISTFDHEHQKVCGCCWQIKPELQFGKDAQGIHGVHHECLSCTSAFRPKKEVTLDENQNDTGSGVRGDKVT